MDNLSRSPHEHAFNIGKCIVLFENTFDDFEENRTGFLLDSKFPLYFLINFHFSIESLKFLLAHFHLATLVHIEYEMIFPLAD